MPKGEMSVRIVIADTEAFTVFAGELLDIAEEARVLWPETGLAARIESAIERFRGPSTVSESTDLTNP